jgi:LPS sulfotransferase NodH
MPHHTQPIPFIIFATQRTGSNWLMGMLDSHPAIAAYDELLLAGVTGSGYWGRTDVEFFESYLTRRNRGTNRLARARWSFRYLDELYAPREGVHAIGMKLMYDQLWRNPWVWAYLLSHRVRVIHLVRRNLLDIVLSAETVKARKQPHAWQGHAVDQAAVSLDPDALLSDLKMLEFRVKTARRLLAALPVAHIEVSYEQLTADPLLLRGVFEFLDADFPSDIVTGPSKFKKLNTSSRAELIANYAEVQKALSATRFSHCLQG